MTNEETKSGNKKTNEVTTETNIKLTIKEIVAIIIGCVPIIYGLASFIILQKNVDKLLESQSNIEIILNKVDLKKLENMQNIVNDIEKKQAVYGAEIEMLKKK